MHRHRRTLIRQNELPARLPGYLVRLAACTLIWVCISVSAYGNVLGKDTLQETLPDLSALDGQIPALPNEDTVSSEGRLEIGMADMDTNDVEAGAEAFEKKVIYTTYDRDSDPLKSLKDSLVIHGDTYQLSSAGQASLIRETAVIPKQFSYESEVFTGDGSEQEPERTISREDGKKYSLAKKDLKEQTAKERTEYKEVVVTYRAVEAGVQIPEAKESEFEDVDTGQMVSAVMDLKTQQITGEYWEDNFTFPVTVTGYDAELFVLNGKQIPKDADLADYGEDFLEYLKLDRNAYEITSVTWNGEPYRENGVVMRNATASGRKWVKDIRAVYGGEVKMPAMVGKVWECLYEEEIPENEKIVYTMAVTARYEREGVLAETVKSLPRRLWEGFVGMITAAYEAVVAAFEEHPVISSITLVLTAALFTFFLAKRIRNACVYDDKEKCPYRKHTAETCRACVNYCKRNRV